MKISSLAPLLGCIGFYEVDSSSRIFFPKRVLMLYS
jgi:hypothetical protein